MSNPAKPVWPDPGTLPFSLFGASASDPAAGPPLAQSFTQPFAQGLTQGLAGGVDFMKKLWGNVPGNTAVPSFLMPTLDLDELDKRISDLRAAESWLEVNLNLLRATIQGLEVQRHTIAAIRSLGAVAEKPPAAPAASVAPRTPSGLPPGWPVARASDDAPSEEAVASPTTREAQGAAFSDPLRSAMESEPAARSVPEPSAGRTSRTKQTARTAKKSATRAPASALAPAMPESSTAPALAGLAASNWLGYMQDQFAKVAKAALASSEIHRPRELAPEVAKKAANKSPAKLARKAASKAIRKRHATTRKQPAPR